MELDIDVDGLTLPATLELPAGPVRGGLVVLHGAEAGERSFFCYRHLGQVLPPEGVAVLRFDRRPGGGADVPFAVQAADAIAAITMLRQRIGDVPIGLWGFSQGAWAAAHAAARYPDRIAFLALVSSCGVSPAVQMRYGTAEQLRRNGFGDTDIADLTRMRVAGEEYLRGRLDRDAAQTVVDRFADCGHHPSFGDVQELAAISPDYTRALTEWITARLPQP